MPAKLLEHNAYTAFSKKNVRHYYYPRFYIIPLAVKHLKDWNFFCLKAYIPPDTTFRVHHFVSGLVVWLRKSDFGTR